MVRAHTLAQLIPTAGACNSCTCVPPMPCDAAPCSELGTLQMGVVLVLALVRAAELRAAKLACCRASSCRAACCVLTLWLGSQLLQRRCDGLMSAHRQKLLRRLYLKVHPDLFEATPAAQRINEASFKALQALINQSHGAAPTQSSLHFFLRPVNGEDGGPLRQVEQTVRAGDGFLADVKRLVHRCEGLPEPAAEEPVPASRRSTLSSMFTQERWWREWRERRASGRGGRPRPCASLLVLSSLLELSSPQRLGEVSPRYRSLNSSARPPSRKLRELSGDGVRKGSPGGLYKRTSPCGSQTLRPQGDSPTAKVCPRQ